MKLKFLYILSFASLTLFSQEKENKELKKARELSKKHTYQGNQSLKGDKPVQAEVEYRNAIAENKDNATAQYNLGTMYYKQKSYDEAFVRLKNASISTEVSHEDKHRIFHNLGNVFMKEKQYDRAVESYKEALRNNPTDEETRYNLAVAKDMLKKNPPPPQDNKNQDDKNQDNQDNKNQDDKSQDNKNQNNQQNQDNQDNKNKENQGDNKENQDKDKGKDQKDPQQDGQDKNPNGEGNGQNRPSSLSPQQMERILEAMNNEDQKTQEKINAQKVKGTRSKSEKDW